jgi:hypothetical protein
MPFQKFLLLYLDILLTVASVCRDFQLQGLDGKKALERFGFMRKGGNPQAFREGDQARHLSGVAQSRLNTPRYKYTGFL